jgi:predicted DNA-binding ribbon-helix-helix protein
MNKAQFSKRKLAIEVIAANPGISAAQLCKEIYAQSTAQNRNYTASLLVQLCESGRIRCISIDSYTVN